jgi:hypothetical protein
MFKVKQSKKTVLELRRSAEQTSNSASAARFWRCV